MLPAGPRHAPMSALRTYLLRAASTAAPACPPRTAGSFPAVALAALIALCAGGAAEGQSVLAPLDTADPVSWYIAEGEAGSAWRESDQELAAWALDAWRRAAGGALELELEPGAEDEARIRIYWVPASAGQYGEMRPLRVQGRRGAAVFIRPDMRALGPDIARAADADPLLRDTIVYLTCLHELGHALGLAHTAEFDDVMYFFGYGGDIPRFFGRYREKLGSRADIRRVSGLSAGDLAQLGRLYGEGSTASGRSIDP